MKKRRRIRVYPKLYPKATAFARREYVECYELEPLNKGYYHGFIAGVKAMRHTLNALPLNLSLGKRRVDKLVENLIGEGKLI